MSWLLNIPHLCLSAATFAEHFAFVIVSRVKLPPACPDCGIFCNHPKTLPLCMLFTDVSDEERHEVSPGQTHQ